MQWNSSYVIELLQLYIKKQLIFNWPKSFYKGNGLVLRPNMLLVVKLKMYAALVMKELLKARWCSSLLKKN